MSSSVHTKQCKKCREFKPATIEYFYADKKSGGLENSCRACRLQAMRDRYHNPPLAAPKLPEGHKQCSKCGEVKTLQEFYKKTDHGDGHTTHCKVCISSSNRAYHATRPETVRVKAKAYRVEHGETARVRSRDWYSQNHHRAVKARRIYYSKNRAKFLLAGQLRRARLAAIPGRHTLSDIEHMRAIQQGRCAYCGRLGQKLHVEHIIPITRLGSSDDPWNLCLACPRCNSSKHNKLLSEWTDRWYLR